METLWLMPSTAPHVSRPLSPAPVRRGDFLLVTCQGGAETALCQRQQDILPLLIKGAWRRGVVTFRLPSLGAGTPHFDPPDDFTPDLIFARAVIHSYGQVSGASDSERIQKLLALTGPAGWDNVHVWQRDHRTEVSPVAIRAALITALAVRLQPADPALQPCVQSSLHTGIDQPMARPGDLVLDCMIDSADRWWVGWHRAASPSSCWPGGIHPVSLPADKVSRAWLKLDEALATFDLTLRPGTRAVELGAAPGGACQRLLEAGLSVVGIDPALVDTRVAALKNFEQWRMRARDVRLKNFRGFDWVVADMNIDPTSTLESIGRIVTASGVRPEGIIATLKLPEWSRADSLGAWLKLFGQWGYSPRARQLSTGGREVCVVALKSAGPAGRRRATRPPGR